MSKHSLKVLHVLSNLGIGGAEVWILALLRHFRERANELGVEVQSDIFLTNGVRDNLDDEATALGARLIYAQYSRKNLPAFIARWRSALREGQYDALHDHQEFSAGWHFLFGLGVLPPVRITHLHNPMTHQQSYSTGLLRRKTIDWGNRLIVSKGTHLLSTSEKLIHEQGFDRILKKGRLKCRALHCGFDPARFNGDRAVYNAAVRQEFNFPAESLVLLFVGRLNSHENDTLNQKNPGFCLEVAKVCATLRQDFRCLVAGGGESMRRCLEDKVREWGLEKQILLIGNRADVPSLMLGADVLLLPSLAEGLGMVAVESQAAGLPVISSDAVPRECMVVDKMVEFLSLSAGPERWAHLVLKKLTAPKPDHRMANQQVMNSPFFIGNSAQALIEIYRGET